MTQNNSNNKPAPIPPRQAWVNTQIVRSIAPTAQERADRQAVAADKKKTPDGEKGNQ